MPARVQFSGAPALTMERLKLLGYFGKSGIDGKKKIREEQLIVIKIFYYVSNFLIPLNHFLQPMMLKMQVIVKIEFFFCFIFKIKTNKDFGF
jgi:hypothetical protein